MPNNSPAQPPSDAVRRPLLSYNPFFIGLRYLVKKKLAYLAALGVALSVGVLIVVMSVFSGFHLQMTSAIRGYLSDLTVKPPGSGRFGQGLHDWRHWRERVLQSSEHIAGVAPFVRGIALMRLPDPGIDYMSYVEFRGVDPALEADVSDLPRNMIVGSFADLRKTYPSAGAENAGSLKACFVGKEFPGFAPPLLLYDPQRLDVEPGRIVLITATSELDKSLAEFAVGGQFDTGNYDYDSQVVVLELGAAMDFVKSGGAVTGLSVKLDDYENAAEVRRELFEDLAPGVTLRRFGESGAVVQRIALSRDGRRLAGLTEDGLVIVWATDTGTELRRLPPEGRGPTALALDFDGELLALGHDDGSAAVYETETGVERFGIPAGAGAVTAVRFSPDGFLLAIGYEHGEAGLWDTDSGDREARLQGHAGAINDVAFDPDGERVVTAGADGTARLWKADSGRTIGTLKDPEGSPLSSVGLGPKGGA
ncbi:MAG: ABC transporter permease, partial [Candidatus Brocadiae bacterium]|nr:ABC transporter permease [Candidatus Brocadiia bacterium]